MDRAASGKVAWLARVTSEGSIRAVRLEPKQRLLCSILLLGNQALYELGPYLLADIKTFVKQHLANLRHGPLFLIGKFLQLPL